jgi:hypothetical protein
VKLLCTDTEDRGGTNTEPINVHKTYNPCTVIWQYGGTNEASCKKNAVNAGLRRKKVLLRLSYMIQKCMAEIPKVLQ